MENETAAVTGWAPTERITLLRELIEEQQHDMRFGNRVWPEANPGLPNNVSLDHLREHIPEGARVPDRMTKLRTGPQRREGCRTYPMSHGETYMAPRKDGKRYCGECAKAYIAKHPGRPKCLHDSSHFTTRKDGRIRCRLCDRLYARERRSRQKTHT